LTGDTCPFTMESGVGIAVARRGDSLPTLDDRYELTTELGRGSTGTVWAAVDRSTTEIVAVKILEPHVLASRHARKRFLREVETASALSHPHVVEVYGHAETSDGGAYLVMERLVGKTLAARLRETGPLPQLLAIRIIKQVLDAVLAAHRRGVVHRDLKPSNVMLIERDGDPDFVKVCDFGLAKDIERDSYDPVNEGDLALAVDLASITTEHGHICGTPEYMAPEQARGEPVDERADLYAISVMLFQAVVGRPPFSARSPLAVVSLHLTATPPRPSELRPDLAIFPALESLILRGLAKDRAERPSSAEVFRSDLTRIERDYARWSEKRGAYPTPSYPLESATVTLAPPVAKKSRPNTAALVALGVGVAAIVSVAWWREAENSEPSRSVDRSPMAVATPARPAVDGRAPTVGASAPTNHGTGPSAGETAAHLVSTELVEAPPNVPPAAPASKRPRSATPVAPRTPLVRANEALAAGRVAEACALGEEAAASSGASPAVWKFLGGCFMRLGERAKGIAYYRRYLEESPSSPDAVFVREMVK